jgi:spore coat protein JC
MWVYERKLQYPIKIKNPNAALAKIIISQLGGPDGELAASTRYLSQRYSMPYREVAGILNGLTEAGVSITDEDGTEHTYARKELSAVTLIDMFDDEDLEYLDEEAEEAVEEWEE